MSITKVDAWRDGRGRLHHTEQGALEADYRAQAGELQAALVVQLKTGATPGVGLAEACEELARVIRAMYERGAKP